MWRGTGGTRLGACLRHRSLESRAGRLGERITPASNTGAARETTAVGLDVSDCCCSDTAQQASASAWVSARAGDGASGSPLCIGQSASAQHSMRACGVAAQPAHRAPLAPSSVRARAKARTRRKRATTSLGCSHGRWRVNERTLGAELDYVPRYGVHCEAWSSDRRITGDTNAGRRPHDPRTGLLLA